MQPLAFANDTNTLRPSMSRVGKKYKVLIWLGFLFLHLAMFSSLAEASKACLASVGGAKEAKGACEDLPLWSKPAAFNPWGWRFGLEVVNNFPFELGGRALLETPTRLRLAFSLGFVLPQWIQHINWMLTDANAYNRDIANLVHTFTEEFMVWRVQLSWRPFARLGFYFGVGYGRFSLQGKVSGSMLAMMYPGLQMAGAPMHRLNYNINVILHNFDAEIGWEWSLFSVMTLRIALGLTKVVAFQAGVKTHIQSGFSEDARFYAEEAGRMFQEKMQEGIERYGIAPQASVSLGFRFF